MVYSGLGIVLAAACSPVAPAATPTATIVVTASPSPSPSPSDSGPADALRNAFEAAQSGGMTQQLDFLACLGGGTEDLEFSTLFGGLAELALVSSGVDPDAYWSALGTSLSEFNATEINRSGDEALVTAQLRLAIKPDAGKLRDLMRASLEERGRPVDEGALNDLVDRLIGRTQIDRVIESDVTVIYADGAWKFCG